MSNINNENKNPKRTVVYELEIYGDDDSKNEISKFMDTAIERLINEVNKINSGKIELRSITKSNDNVDIILPMITTEGLSEEDVKKHGYILHNDTVPFCDCDGGGRW